MCQGFKDACHKKLIFKSLQSTVAAFWGLNRQSQAHLLRTLHGAAHGDDAGDPEMDGEGETAAKRKPTQWQLCGVSVCLKNFAYLLSLGQGTIAKMLKGLPDGRAASMRPGLYEKSHCVDFFFYELYHSAAEPLPCDGTKQQMTKLKAKSKVADADIWFDEVPWLAEGDDPNQFESENAAAVSTSSTSATSGHREDWNPDAPSVGGLVAFTIASSAQVVGLPHRYISHCHLHDLYWLFEASWDSLRGRSATVVLTECPSFSLFRTRWQIWKRYIKIRKPAQFSQCQTCWELQRAMNARDSNWTKRGQAAQELRIHYQNQYMDRCIYWSMRWASKLLGSILCIIIDSMDKTKMSYPRWPFDRKPKSLEGVIRPRFIFTLAIAHRWCTAAFVQDEIQNHGSSAFCEVLVRVVEHIYQMSLRSRRAFPLHLVIQADNTVSQAKNQYAFIALAFFVARYKFLTANIFFLLVGHTHEDVDQMFGVVLSLVLQRHRFQTPEDFLSLLQRELSDRCLAQGHQLITESLSAIRDFKTWLAPMNCKLSNAFGNRSGEEAPHAFSFKLRRDLCRADIEDVCRPGRLEPGHPNDVVCCVKTYMRSPRLQDPPTLILPYRQDLRVTGTPMEVKRVYQLTEKQIDDYLALAKLCEQEFNLPLAAARLIKLVTSRVYDVPGLTWLEKAEQERQGTFELGDPIFPHLPATSWKLICKID